MYLPPNRPRAVPPPDSEPDSEPDAPIPAYLRETYTWAYLSRTGTRFFDHQAVVSAILWGNARRLIAWAAGELAPGWRVLQPAAVYGSFSRDLAARLGPDGHLEVADVAPIQVALTTAKLADLPQAAVVRRDAASPPAGRPYDAVVCFFLLHEVPEATKAAIVATLLAAVRPGGKVVFVDYHRPAAWHPLRLPMAGVFRLLEPYAAALWRRDIATYAPPELAADFTWRKHTRFGGLYQKVVAERHA